MSSSSPTTSAAAADGAAGAATTVEQFRNAMAVFETFPLLDDDDLRVLLRSLGSVQLRRVLGIGHTVLMGTDAHYAARISARDRTLELAQQQMLTQGTTPSPMPGPLLKSMGKAAGPPLKAMPAKPPSTSPPPSSSTSPPKQPTGTEQPKTKASSVAKGVPATTTPKKATIQDPPASPAKAKAASAAPIATPAKAVVQQKRPPQRPSDYDSTLAAVFTQPYVDTVPQDLELMAPPPSASPSPAPPLPPPSSPPVEVFFDELAPDLEDFLQATAAASQPVSTSDVEDATPEDPVEQDDDGGQDDGDDQDDDDDQPRVTSRRLLCVSPAQPDPSSTAGASTATGANATAEDTDEDDGAPGPSQPTPVPDPPVAKASFPSPAEVSRDQARLARRRDREERLRAWEGWPEPCDLLTGETNVVWNLPPGVPAQPPPGKYADHRVEGYCNLGCETRKADRTPVCQGRCFRPIIRTRSGKALKSGPSDSSMVIPLHAQEAGRPLCVAVLFKAQVVCSYVVHARARHAMSAFDYHSFVDFMQAAVSAGLSSQTIDKMSELGFESIHDAALRAKHVDHRLAGEIEVMLVTSGYKDHMEASQGSAPPRGPAPRFDQPAPRTSAGGMLNKALAAADPLNSEEALRDFRDNVYARSARAPNDARWVTWCKICAAWGISPVPLTADTIEKVGTSFRSGGYRSSAQYFSRARKEHIHVTGQAVPPPVELAIRDAIRSIERGMGTNSPKDAFRLDSLDICIDLLEEGLRFHHAMVVLGSWFLCREIELSALRVKHMTLDSERKQVCLTLSASKNDTVGSMVQRRHSCYCGTIPETICPYHAALRIADQCSSDSEAFIFAADTGEPMTKAQTIEAIHAVLTAADVPLTRAGAPLEPEVNRFGGHCLRVSGAQHLCRMRIPVSTIMLLGRWGSRAIERYVQDTELEDALYGIAAAGLPTLPTGPAALKDKTHDSPPWTLVHNLEESEPAPPPRPTKKARSTKTDAEDKEAVAAMIGSLDDIAARLESIQDRPDLVCKRKAHMRDPEESSRPPAKWRARCGWPYGYSNFTRAHDDGSQNLCLKCFPEAGAESRKKAAGQQPSDTESTDSYVVMDTGLRALLLDAGASDDLIAYVATKGILSTAIFAEMGEDVKEFDQAMVQPLASPFKLQDGKVFEVSDAELPVARARLRHAWRKAREKSAPNTASSSPTTTAAAATSTSKTKELPPGYWQQQIHKYEAVLIHGVPRKFPEMTLLGAEAVIAKLLNDAKNLAHNAIPLEEIVQHRHFTAALLPNTLSSARKRARSQEQVTTLVVNADLQLETEPETPWKPKSQVAILDCLEAIRVALIFIEYAPESDIDEYFSWWQRLVRSRPNKIDQLKIHWENTSWRIALALRKKQPFRDIAHEIMADSQLLQEAMSTEVQPDRPARAPRNTETPWHDIPRGGRGRGKGRNGKGQQRWWERSEGKGNGKGGGKHRYQPQYDRQWNHYQGRGRQQEEDRPHWQGHGKGRQHDDDRSQWSPLPRSRRSPDDDKQKIPQPVTLRSKAETIRIKNGDRPPDIVMLSFFDGLGTACLICDEYCSSNGLQWRGASWEIDPNLKKLLQEHFPEVVQRGDFDQETPESLHNLVQELDPAGRATVVIAGGPPCHDFSRIRSDAPGHQGTEGSKFARFAQLVVDLEKRWQRPRAVVMVENVIPQNRADMRKIEKSLDSPAVVHDAADFGTISRPRVWWCRVPWQEIAHRPDCPLRIRWTTMQGIPRVHFDLVKDDPHAFKTEGLSLPRCLVEEGKPLPCLTTPSDDPQGRPAPRSSKGKISSEANQRWRADRQRFAPWHYEAGVMMADSQGRFVIPPPSVKEQWHHLPQGWTSKLSEHERHKALANGWHAGAARLIFIMAMFAATPAKADKELNPLGGTALDIAAGLWQGRPPLLGPGPGDYDSFDLSYLQDPAEHWKLSRHMPHPDHRDALMEPGLQQWIRIWFQMRAHLAELRLAVVEQVEEMVADMEDETRSWYQSLRPHVQKAYRSTTGVCTLQLPALRRICELFGWQDLGIFDELTHGFRLLGPLAPGLGWKRRNDDRYANPLDLAEFMVKNKQYVVDKLRRCRVDPCWKQMADEIAADVSLGRMEGPFTSPSDWP
ncbi:unnamed protein product [Symbiodinium sp. CCMP2592]|nr:unnamed protein product [Symbiodinium sp. CCMP2592]